MFLKWYGLMATMLLGGIVFAGGETVKFLPDRESGKIQSQNSIWGVAGHFIHQTKFDRTFSPYWGPEYTIPWIVRANLEWVREPLYQNLFVNESAEVRQPYAVMIDDYLASYDQAGIRVILCPMFDLPSSRFDAFIDWVAELAKRHPSVEVIELHNEPNLKDFWKYTPQDYVACCKRAYERIKQIVPDRIVCTGAFSNFGKAGEHPNLVKKYNTGDKMESLRLVATGYFRECLDAGLLEYSDAFSFHPYNETSEGASSYWLPKTDPDGFEKELWDLVALVNSYNKTGKQIHYYFTELGRSVSRSHCPDEQSQADYLSRVMLVLLGVRINGFPLEAVCWYDLKCDDFKQNVPPHESSFGLISNDASRGRPSYWYYTALINYFGDPDEFQPALNRVISSQGSIAFKYFAWQKRDGRLVIPFWRMIQIETVGTDFPSVLTINGITAPVKAVHLFDPAAAQSRSIGFRQKENQVEVPVQVYSRANWLELFF